MQAVLDRVQPGTTYDENPPQRPYPLAAFLFDTKTGYCQQFSGVMALMLRMGGVPARVASGFSPGSYNSERKDYVVRDTDAHSWVEAYFPPYGWITFDPTPGRVAGQLAARRQRRRAPTAGRRCRRTSAAAWASRATARSRPATPAPASRRPAGAAAGSCPSAPALVALLALLGAITLWRRRTPFATLAPEVAELQRALHRSGRDPSPDVTLARLESVLGGSDAAAAYVRAVRDRRYARSTAPPTAAQRRALRRQLGSGLGLAGVRCAHGGRSRRCRAERSRIACGVRTLRSRHGQRVRPLHERDPLLDNGDFHAAVVPLARARDLEPDKASVREALGRALFGARRYREAAAEFEAVVEHAPTNDYALFCLGRSLQLLGRHAEARKPLALASCLRPEREDYSKYLGQARRRAA